MGRKPSQFNGCPKRQSPCCWIPAAVGAVVHISCTCLATTTPMHALSISPSLFQITRCAQNRLPREQPAPAPDSEPTAIPLRSPYCAANFHRTPQRTPPAAQSRPHPAHSRPGTRKSVTLPRHPFPAQPHPIPRTSHLFPTAAPFLPTNPSPVPQFCNGS